MLANRRWQDILNLLIGAWLFASPWALRGATDAPMGVMNAHVFGLVIMLFAALAVLMPKVWEEGINIALGLWMIASPWALSFATHRDLAANSVIVGVLVTVLAALAMVNDKTFAKWWHDHHAAT